MSDYRDIYPTVQGDTWDAIAFKVYGDSAYMVDLIRANPAHIGIAVFSAGVELVCPDVATPVAQTLPPWKRGESNA